MNCGQDLGKRAEGFLGSGQLWRKGQGSKGKCGNAWGGKDPHLREVWRWREEEIEEWEMKERQTLSRVKAHIFQQRINVRKAVFKEGLGGHRRQHRLCSPIIWRRVS